MMVGDIEQQTLRLAIDRLEEALRLARDVQARRGPAWPLEKAMAVSVCVAKLKGLVLQ